MQYVILGKTGLKASRIGYGCSRIASLSSDHSPSEVRSTLLKAFNQGVNFFDTANVYGQGDSERMLGKLIRGKRDQVILCSKAGMTISMSQTFIRSIKPLANIILRNWKRGRTNTIAARKQKERQCFEPDYLKNQIEGSLRRLGTDYLDIFLLHIPPMEIIKDETVFEMLEKLKQKGLIRFIGVSCETPETAIASMSRVGIECVQVPVNLMETGIIKRVLPFAHEKGIGVISREPFAGGALFTYPAFQKFHAKHSKWLPSHLALKYALQQDDSSVVLTGMSCLRHLEENMQILSLPELPEEEATRGV